jgi:hypothetical protein
MSPLVDCRPDVCESDRCSFTESSPILPETIFSEEKSLDDFGPSSFRSLEFDFLSLILKAVTNLEFADSAFLSKKIK